jgi:outer membrane protein assembly factor BamD
LIQLSTLGINSVPAKMEERLIVAKTAYSGLIKFKADTIQEASK